MAIRVLFRSFTKKAKLTYIPTEALPLIKAYAVSPYDESVDVSIALNVDAKKTDQIVRGTCAMPAGLGKKVRVAVFTSDANKKLALECGADLAGESLLMDIKEGKLDFDKTIATHEMIDVLKQYGKILGPKGLMPTLKLGNVVPPEQLAETIKTMKMGTLLFKCEKAGIIHTSIGRVSFSDKDLLENLRAFISAVNRLKPAAVKGNYLKNAYIKSTQGPAWPLEVETIDTAGPRCLI